MTHEDLVWIGKGIGVYKAYHDDFYEGIAS
jgi:hypothetical protein